MKGYYRDKRIIETIQAHRCLNTEQVQALIFRGMPAGLRKCQQRLKKITDRGQLKRWRYSLEEPYAYYSDLAQKVEQMEHLILLNWVYVWMQLRLKSWETLQFEYERDYAILRRDAFATIKNNATGDCKFYFIELDRTTNTFDKVKKYNDLYESDNYMNDWWVSHTKRFPRIIIATTNAKRLKRFNETVEKGNRNGLEFSTCLVDYLRNEVIM
jgi:hypothetical protein